MPTIRATPAEIAEMEAEALRRGGTVTAAQVAQTGEPVPSNEQGSPRMVEASVHYTGTNKLAILIPCVTRSEANEPAWAKKMRRKLSAKRATRETIGPYWSMLGTFVSAYHAGQSLLVTFTRLGGRRLDRGNLAVSMKAVEDVVAGALLADDGDSRWRVSYEQEPGGAVGVRVEIEVLA